MTALPSIPQEELAGFCRRWEIVELSLFGSAVPDSDLDFMVQFADSARPSLFDLVRLKDELEELVGRKADFVTKPAIEASQSQIRRQSILESARPVYSIQ